MGSNLSGWLMSTCGEMTLSAKGLDRALPEGVSTRIGGRVMSVESKDVTIIFAWISLSPPPRSMVSVAPKASTRKRSIPVESSTR